MAEVAVDSLHVLGSRQYGGADRFFVRLIMALRDRRHRAEAVVRPHSPVATALIEAGVPVYQVPLANQWDLWSVFRVRALVRRLRPPVVQTYMGRATRLTRLGGLPGVAHVARLGGYYKVDGYYRHADAWVGNTRGICDYLQAQGLDPQRVHYIGNFVDPPVPAVPGAMSRLRSEHGLPAAALVVYTLGRFVAKKGFQDLLRAFASLPPLAAGRPVYLVLSGTGPMDAELRRLARDLAVAERVLWTGWQDQPGHWFNAADLFVCPSREEPLGNVILEAWSYGLPLVSTATPGALSLISDGENGLLCPSANPPALAATLAKALAMDPPARARLGGAGAEEVRRHHHRDAVVGAYLALYRALTAVAR